MNFAKILFFAFACFVALGSVAAAPKPWNPFKALERVGQNVRDGIVKAAPAIAVVSSAKALGK